MAVLSSATSFLLMLLTVSAAAEQTTTEPATAATESLSREDDYLCNCHGQDMLQSVTQLEERVQVHHVNQTEQVTKLEKKVALLQESMLQNAQVNAENQAEQRAMLGTILSMLQKELLQNIQDNAENQAEEIAILQRKLDVLLEWPPSWLCPEHFTHNSESRMCIKLYRDRVTWAAANNSCHTIGRGYRLAVVDTNGKLQFVQAFLSATDLRRNGFGVQCWVGGHQEDDEGRWLWSTEAKVIHGWGDGQPNDAGSGSQNCLSLAWGPDWTTWMLNDNECTDKEPYICEYQFN